MGIFVTLRESNPTSEVTVRYYYINVEKPYQDFTLCRRQGSPQDLGPNSGTRSIQTLVFVDNSSTIPFFFLLRDGGTRLGLKVWCWMVHSKVFKGDPRGPSGTSDSIFEVGRRLDSHSEPGPLQNR